MNRSLFHTLVECGGKGVKGARHRFGKRAHRSKPKAASPFAPPSPELCRRTPKRGHGWTSASRFMAGEQVRKDEGAFHEPECARPRAQQDPNWCVARIGSIAGSLLCVAAPGDGRTPARPLTVHGFKARNCLSWNSLSFAAREEARLLPVGPRTVSGQNWVSGHVWSRLAMCRGHAGQSSLNDAIRKPYQFCSEMFSSCPSSGSGWQGCVTLTHPDRRRLVAAAHGTVGTVSKHF